MSRRTAFRDVSSSHKVTTVDPCHSAFLPRDAAFAQSLLEDWPNNWTTIERAQIETNTQSVIILSGYAVNNKIWDDSQITFFWRATSNADQVQIWAGFCYRDRDSRYVLASTGRQ